MGDRRAGKKNRPRGPVNKSLGIEKESVRRMISRRFVIVIFFVARSAANDILERPSANA